MCPNTARNIDQNFTKRPILGGKGVKRLKCHQKMQNVSKYC